MIKHERRKVREIPAQGLTGITLATHGVALSSDLISFCSAQNIPLLFLSPHGQLDAVLSSPQALNGEIGLMQLKALADGAPALELAKSFVAGKIKNQANLMKYFHKYPKRVDANFSGLFSGYLESVRDSLAQLKQVTCQNGLEAARGQLFGIEGSAARAYWQLFGLLLNGRGNFAGRVRHGATDLVNSMLNYGYAILQARVYLAIVKAGLVPQISFLHSTQRGKPTLSFDLIEEFRSQAVDRIVLTMFARKEPAVLDENARLTLETRQKLISRLQTCLAALVEFRRKEMKLDEVIQHQTYALVRHLQKQRKYEPFIEKW